MKGFTLRRNKGTKLAAGLALVALGVVLGGFYLWRIGEQPGMAVFFRIAYLLCTVAPLLCGMRLLVDAGKANTVFRTAPDGIYHREGGKEYFVPWQNIKQVVPQKDKASPAVTLVLYQPVEYAHEEETVMREKLYFQLAGCSPAPRAVYKQLGEMHLFYSALLPKTLEDSTGEP